MKLAYKLFLILSSIALFSCMEEAFVEGPTAAQGLTAEIPSYQFDNQTRVNISQNLSTFTWSDGDQIGIYGEGQYNNEGNAAFTIKNGGSNSGVFTNDIFALKPNSTYYAFYPYDSKARIEAYPVDFTGQIQTANGSTAHIGSRNYMSAEVNTDASGSANISFQNLAAVIQVVIPIEEDGTYTRVTLSSTDNDFIAQGSLNMKTGEIKSTGKTQSLELLLGEGLSMKAGDVLTANILVAPTDMTGKELTVTLNSIDGESLVVNFTGMSMQAGKAYKLADGNLTEIPYLTFTAEAEQTLTMSRAVETLEYSVNNGAWQTLETGTVTFGGANGNLRLRGKSAKGTAISSNDYSQISFGNSVKVTCSGDIRTLVDYINYKTVETSNARFCELFGGCSNLVTAPELPSVDLAESCYYGMFEGCSSLTIAPKLPATTLTDYCYCNMFYDCTGLITAPELSSSILGNCCYRFMFYGCTNLTTAPELPATTLARSCYSFMFYGCTKLTNAPELPAIILADYCYEYMFCNAGIKEIPKHLQDTEIVKKWIERNVGLQGLFAGLPITDEYLYTVLPVNSSGKYYLPSTTLSYGCYDSMFYGCTSLNTAPELPATTLAPNCYYNMFNGCTKIDYIKMLATDISATSCLGSWTARVSSSGTFIKNPAATWDVRGTSGIPEGWTIKYDDESGNGNGSGTINPGNNHEG